MDSKKRITISAKCTGKKNNKLEEIWYRSTNKEIESKYIGLEIVGVVKSQRLR